MRPVRAPVSSILTPIGIIFSAWTENHKAGSTLAKVILARYLNIIELTFSLIYLSMET